MNVNDLVKAYASGEYSRERLEETFRAIGFSSQITDILLSRADGKKAIYEYDQNNNVDASRFSIDPDECITKR